MLEREIKWNNSEKTKNCKNSTKNKNKEWR